MIIDIITAQNQLRKALDYHAVSSVITMLHIAPICIAGLLVLLGTIMGNAFGISLEDNYKGQYTGVNYFTP